MRLDLGCPVQCADAAYGELADIVIDPSTRRVTHLVVQPHDRHDLARLVPIDRASERSDPAGGILLDSTVAEVSATVPVQKSAYLRLGEFPVEDPEWQVGVQETFALPYYSSFAPDGLTMQPLDSDPHVTVGYDRVPKDKVEIRRASQVTSSDGHDLGHVDGFVVESDDHISHFVLQAGHLWGKREITIPIGAADRIESDEVILNLTVDEVGALKAVRVHRWLGI
jgi:sporulation protein YlmC with PRC-barrel domain